LLGNAFELLTRTGLDWIHKYPAIADACALTAPILQHCPGGVGFGHAAALVFFLFDRLHLDAKIPGARR